MPLIICEVNLILTWSESYVISDSTTQDAYDYADPAVPEIRAPEIWFLKLKIQNCMFQLLLYQLKMIINYLKS